MVKAGSVDPHECETTLADVMTGLGLAPLSSQDEQMIRNELGVIIGRGLRIFEESAKQNPHAKLTVRVLQMTLTQVADALDAAVARQLDADQFAAIDKVLKGTETGDRESHDIEVALRIRSTLAQEIGLNNARDRMIAFHKWPRTYRGSLSQGGTGARPDQGGTRPAIARMVLRFQTRSDVCCRAEWHTHKGRNQSANPRGTRSFLSSWLSNLNDFFRDTCGPRVARP